jgi:predicted ATP-grasp superfamily ATP-dependent carboligase
MGNEHTLTNHAEQVVKVVSTKSAEKLIQGHGFLFLKEGSVSGIPASLLNEGTSRGFM